MWSSIVPSGALPFYAIIVLSFGTFLTTLVAVWRRWKTGQLEDSGTLLKRYDDDNRALRIQLLSAENSADLEREKRVKAEELNSIFRRQLRENGITPFEEISNDT